eukprot:753194-Hanusia_phi.AAC.1
MLTQDQQVRKKERGVREGCEVEDAGAGGVGSGGSLRFDPCSIHRNAAGDAADGRTLLLLLLLL